jgi:hypothetical protein
MGGGDGPLRQRYELVVLRQGADGRLELTTLGLFFQGARPGDRKSFHVRCAPSPDEYGTAFAVVACERPHEYTILSVQSVKVPPGGYILRAELTAPDTVHFHGLPSELRDDFRSWPRIVATIPDRVERLGPAHLIVAVEFSGDSDHVLERIDHAEQLIRRATAGADDELRVSVVSYGPHKVQRDEKEQAPSVLTWADTTEAAQDALTYLTEQKIPPLGYWRAAQLECVLTLLAGKISTADGRPVLVSIGSRTAFPKQLDPHSEIIPCPYRRDWRAAIQALNAHDGMAFGAIRDHGEDAEVWSHLGRSAFGWLGSVNPQNFAIELGLVTDNVQTLPLPLTLSEGA